jgi:ABC-type Co2+ transport system permease subunit
MKLLNYLKENWIGILVAFISGFHTPIVLEYIGWQPSFLNFLLVFLLIYIPLSIVGGIIKKGFK